MTRIVEQLARQQLRVARPESFDVNRPDTELRRLTENGSLLQLSKFEKMDTIRIETDLGPGWASSPEQTALDLCRNRPDWQITESAKSEMIRRLADRIDWQLINEIAEQTRGQKTLRRLRARLDRPTA